MKETILAIILGSLLGFGLTGGYFAIKKSQQNQNSTNTPIPTETISETDPNTPSKVEPSPTSDDSAVTSNSDTNLTISSPENESIVNNSQITIKGSTTPLSTIIITTATNSYFSTADSTGNFSQTIEVDSGLNQIQIDSLDKNDNQSTKKILVTYSTAKI